MTSSGLLDVTTARRGPGEPSLFDRAASVFDGWDDPQSGLRVLRIHTLGHAEGSPWSTPYHQFPCFLDGGRKVLLHDRSGKGRPQATFLLDLTTGQTEHPFPAGTTAREVCDRTGVATLIRRSEGGTTSIIWDLRAGRELASLDSDGWIGNCINLLSDGRRAIVFLHQGKPYGEKVRSRHWLLTPGEQPRLLLDLDGWFCSHVQSCPADPELYAYDRWPSPMRPIEQAIRLRTLDGKRDEPMPMQAETLKPGDTWGARDHYVWAPDSSRIISYLCPHPIDPLTKDHFNHFEWEWWLSATDWRTGEDLAAKYPPGRWGGHMQMSPDSRWIVCCGGPGFDKLFLVSVEGLRGGWNERVLCAYPKTVSEGKNSDPFPYPWVLPDQSGVIFNAGWPGPEHGVYLCQWPGELR